MPTAKLRSFFHQLNFLSWLAFESLICESQKAVLARFRNIPKIALKQREGFIQKHPSFSTLLPTVTLINVLLTNATVSNCSYLWECFLWYLILLSLLKTCLKTSRNQEASGVSQTMSLEPGNKNAFGFMIQNCVETSSRNLVWLINSGFLLV